MTGGADWSQTLPDLLRLILQRLPVVDIIRFGAVCKPWRSAQMDHQNRRPVPPPPLQIPWLMLPGDESGTSETFLFFSHAEKTEYLMHLPEIRDRRCIGSSEGWLIWADADDELHMLNPITKSLIDLPSITTIPSIRDDHSEPSACCWRKVVLSQPFTPSSFTAVAICRRICRLVFTRAGDRSWTVMGGVLEGNLVELLDIIFCKGVLYALNSRGGITAWDLSRSSAAPVAMLTPDGIPIGTIYHWFLAECSGKLLVVFTTAIRRARLISVKVFEVRGGCMVTVESLDGHALFLGVNQSVCLPVRDFPELIGNCIYFTQNIFCAGFSLKGDFDRFTGVYNMENQHVWLHYPDDYRLNWPPPTWFSPSLQFADP